MKKKIIAMGMAVAVLFGTVPLTQAAKIKDKLVSTVGADIANTLLYTSFEVPTDIMVKNTDEVTYVNGPAYVTSTTGSGKFDFKADINMSKVLDALAYYKEKAYKYAGDDTDMQNEVKTAYAQGQFEITIDYPVANFNIPNEMLNGTSMFGFSSEKEYTQIFQETVARDATTDGKLVIKIDVKPGATIEVLEKYLDDLSLECKAVEVSNFGTYQVKGSIKGYTTIKVGDEEIGKFTYNFNQEDGKKDPELSSESNDITGTVISRESSQSGGLLVTKRTLTVVDGETVHKFTYDNGKTINVVDLAIPSKFGYKLQGLYYDEALTNAVGETIRMTEDRTIYTKWVEDVIIPEVKPPLEFEEHFAYVIGYPVEDGREEVRPENNITREEIATIFYRLLTDEVREELFTSENNFTDVDADRWSNKAISTIANGEYIKGYEDDTFNPASPITRAEFVTIASRFYGVDVDTVINTAGFVDSEGHWAESCIKFMAYKNLIDGYEDDEFKPNKYITRAEVMKIINGMLNRCVDADGLHKDAKTWVDNSADKWYYYEVIEATNPHTYERTEDSKYEVWTAIVENKIIKDKAQYEDA